MGWSWALWFRCDCLADVMVVAEANRVGREPEEARRAQVLADGRAALVLPHDRPVLAHYVDTAN
eukprot:4813029-Lingulodinium_polyedra.AAC.1